MKYRSECPGYQAGNCRATQPRVRGCLEDEIPKSLKADREWLNQHPLKICTYCGRIWYEEWDNRNLTKRKITVWLGHHVG